MKTVYFDCFAGVSGDMILGALVDAGVPLEQLESELSRLGVEGYQLTARKCVKNGITGTSVTVSTEEQSAHRHLHHIEEIIGSCSLADSIKEKGLAIFRRLAEAEAKIHDTTPEKIHFHEVGALDAIVDVMGAVIGLDLLGANTIWASPVHIGTGFVVCAHGKIPLPAPATLEILHGVPTYSTGIKAELTTPTGAAVLTTLAERFGPMPSITVDRVGYGAGTRDLEIPNLLRLVVGVDHGDGYLVDQVELVEANIDDMNPEQFEYVIDRLMQTGALDVTLTPVIMKKSRPATCLSLLARPDDASRLLDVIFTETTTLGIRRQTVQRQKLPRETITVQSLGREVRVKVARLGDQVKVVAPEYEDCRRAASETEQPLKEIYRLARSAAYQELGLGDYRRSDNETV